MNVGCSAFQWNWVQISPGDYEVQGEYAYYRAKRNDTLKKWALGRRLHPQEPIRLVGLFPTLKAAKERAERGEVSL